MKPGSGSGDAHGETMHIGSLADGYGSLRVLVGEASSSVEDWMCFFFFWLGCSITGQASRKNQCAWFLGKFWWVPKLSSTKTQSKTRNHETWQRYIHGALSWLLKTSDCQSCLLHYCMLLHAILPYLALKLTYIMLFFFDFSIFLIIFALPPMV